MSELEKAIEMTNNIADMAVYNYIPNNKNEMVLKGKTTYILGDKGRTAIKTVLQALESYKRRYELALEQNMKDYKDSIPKKKIEDKIKAYEKLIDDVSESEQYSNEIPLYRHDIQVLQELLEDK